MDDKGLLPAISDQADPGSRMPPSPPEDIHSRLNRALWRARIGGWPAAVGTLGVFAVVLFMVLQVPAETDFREAEVTGVFSHMTESGPRQSIGVRIDGTDMTVGTRAMLLHPAKGEIICVRQTRYWPFGNVRREMTDIRFCRASFPTGSVD